MLFVYLFVSYCLHYLYSHILHFSNAHASVCVTFLNIISWQVRCFMPVHEKHPRCFCLHVLYSHVLLKSNIFFRYLLHFLTWWLKISLKIIFREILKIITWIYEFFFTYQKRVSTSFTAYSLYHDYTKFISKTLLYCY